MEFLLIILSSFLFTIPYYSPELFFLSFLAFIPLIYLVENCNYRHSFIIAMLVGFINSLFSLYWLYKPLTSILKMPFSFNIFVLFLYFLISALALAVWVLLNKFLQPQASYSPFIAAFSWTVLEYLRFEFFNFNPFNYFAYTQSSFSLLSQYASYGGIFLVSFITVLIASYLVKIYLDPNWKKAIPLLLILIILFMVPLFKQSASEQAIIHKNIDLVVTENSQNNNNFKKIEAELKNLASLIRNTESKYIFSAENSLSFDFVRNNYYRNQFKAELEQGLENYYLQLGSQAAVSDSYDAKRINSLFLLTDDLKQLNRSNKESNILLKINFPYLKEIINSISNYLKFDHELASLVKANRMSKVDGLTYYNIFSGEIFMPLISRDINYFEKTNELNLIVNSAAEGKINSKVYNNLALAAAVYRAAETNTVLVRVVSGGYSAYIDSQGKILFKKRLQNKRETINLTLNKKVSYYQKYPNRIINIIIIIFIIILLVKIFILLKNKWSSRN